MQKENKRCLPKEGRPHAHGVCQKKRERKDAYPKKVCHKLAKACQRKKLIARVGNNKRERESFKRIHPQITRNSPNTCTS